MTGTGEGFTADDAAITFGEVKSVHDAAESLRGLAKSIGAGLEAQNRCAEIKLRAERRMGDELGKLEKQTGGDAMRARLHDATEAPPKLSDLGINKSQSSRWQAVAPGQRAMGYAMRHPEPEKGGRGKKGAINGKFSGVSQQRVSEARIVLSKKRSLRITRVGSEPS